MTEGKKYDTGKPPMSLLPPYSLEEVSKVLGFGAEKYGPRNWKLVGKKNGLDFQDRYLGAALRHINEIMKGNYFDEETGLRHEAHAICCLMFCLDIKATSTSQKLIPAVAASIASPPDNASESV